MGVVAESSDADASIHPLDGTGPDRGAPAHASRATRSATAATWRMGSG